MLAVYETIDLGLVSTLLPLSDEESPLDLLQANHPLFVLDPIHDDVVYVSHAFGVHAIHLEPVLKSLERALRCGEEGEDDQEEVLENELADSVSASVHPMLSTFSVERR